MLKDTGTHLVPARMEDSTSVLEEDSRSGSTTEHRPGSHTQTHTCSPKVSLPKKSTPHFSFSLTRASTSSPIRWVTFLSFRQDTFFFHERRFSSAHILLPSLSFSTHSPEKHSFSKILGQRPRDSSPEPRYGHIFVRQVPSRNNSLFYANSSLQDSESYRSLLVYLS